MAALSMGTQRPGRGWVGERRPGRAVHAVAMQQYRRRPRLGVLRQGGTMLALLAGFFAALQRESAVVAQCTGGGLSDEVLCRALGKQCGEIAGEALRVVLSTPHFGCCRLYILLTGSHAGALCQTTAMREPDCRQLWHYDHLSSLRGQYDLHRPFLLPPVPDMRRSRERLRIR